MTLKAQIYACEICGAEFRLEHLASESKCSIPVADHAETDQGIVVAIFMRLRRNVFLADGLRAFDTMAGQPNPLYGVAVCEGCKRDVRAVLASRDPKVFNGPQ
jgi:hypothetical protein